MTNFTMILPLMDQIELITVHHKKMNTTLGKGFNIFSILNMERKEVGTHSALLYDLINPNGSHGQGQVYLEVFIRKTLDIEGFDLKNLIVDRERFVGKFGRIDLVIENKDSIIIIEMKIDADDQERQLERYFDYGSSTNKKCRIFYLTLDGHEVSEHSKGGMDVGEKCISFKYDIVSFVKSCIKTENTPLIPVIRESLVQYLELLEKITGRLEGGLLMDIKDILLKGNNLQLADTISRAIPFCKAELEFNFWEAVIGRCNDHLGILGVKYFDEGFLKNKSESIEELVNYQKKNKEFVCFYFEVMEVKSEKLIIEVGANVLGNKIYMCLYFEREDEYIEFQEYDDIYQNKILGLGFIDEEEFKCLDLNNKFDLKSDDIYMLTDSEKFSQIVKEVSDEIIEISKRVVAEFS